VKARVCLEYSTPAEKGIQYRPSIMQPVDPQAMREVVCLKHHKIPGTEIYDEEGFDKSKFFDTVYPVPGIKIPAMDKGQVLYSSGT
jgi:hypothetical protein